MHAGYPIAVGGGSGTGAAGGVTTGAVVALAAPGACGAVGLPTLYRLWSLSSHGADQIGASGQGCRCCDPGWKTVMV